MVERIAASGGLSALLQLADSALPIGRYVHSHGLESWLMAHPDAATDELIEVVWSAVEAVATLDAVVLRCAFGDATLSGIIELDRSLYEAKPVAECGEALGPLDPATDEYLAAVRRNLAPGCLAVVEARLLGAAGVCAVDAVTALLTGSAAALLSTAVRLARLGPRAAQTILWQGRDQFARLTAMSLDIEPANIFTAAIQLEIHLMRHRTRTGNLFST